MMRPYRNRWINTRVVSEWCPLQNRYVTVEKEGYWHCGPVAEATHVEALMREAQSLAFEDDGGEASQTAISSGDFTWPLDSTFCMRFQIEEYAGGKELNQQGQLQYRIDTGGGFGAWNNVTTTSAVKAVTSANLDNGFGTTQVISFGKYYTVNEGQCTDGLCGDSGLNDFSDGGGDGNGSIEYLYAVQLDSASINNADKVQLQVVESNGTVISHPNTPQTITASAGTPTRTASGSPSITIPTAAGSTKVGYKGSGSPSIGLPTAAGTSVLWPKVYLNTTESLSGATEMTVESVSPDGTSITFTDPEGAPTGSVFLGVENRNDGGLAWIPVTVSAGTSKSASGAVTISIPTASGSAKHDRKGSGSPSLSIPTATGAAKLGHNASDGAPSLSVPTAAGAATKIAVRTASGTPLVAIPTASGTAVRSKGASGAANISIPTAAGSATLTRNASGTPSISIPTASGAAVRLVSASGASSISAPTTTGSASIAGAITASGEPTLSIPTATGASEVKKIASGGVLIPSITAAGSSFIWPKVYLNTTQTLAGATEMTILSASADGTSITFADPVGAPTGSLFLGVENRDNGDVGWIAVTVSAPSSSKTASGAATISIPTAAGAALVARAASGAATMPMLTAAGQAKFHWTASGDVTIPLITASGVAADQTPPAVFFAAFGA